MCNIENKDIYVPFSGGKTVKTLARNNMKKQRRKETNQVTQPVGNKKKIYGPRLFFAEIKSNLIRINFRYLTPLNRKCHHFHFNRLDSLLSNKLLNSVMDITRCFQHYSVSSKQLEKIQILGINNFWLIFSKELIVK